MLAGVLRIENFAGTPSAAHPAGLVIGGQFVATRMTIVFVGGDLFVELLAEFFGHFEKIGHFCLQPAGNDCG